MKPIVYIAGAIALVFLVACGGGGGGAGTAKPTGSLVGTSCSVPSGASDCQATLSVTTSGASTAMVTSANGASIVAPVNQNASVPVKVTLGSETYTLNCGIECTATATVNAICAPGTYTTGSMCVGKLSYASVVYGLASDVAYPVKISGTSCANMTAVLAKNETRFQWGFYPHFNAWLHTGMFPSGRLRVSAQMPSDADKRHQVVLNPLTNTLSDYYEEEGSMPSVDPIDSGWYRATSPDGSHPDPTVAIYAYTGDQTIFTSQVRPDVLRCVENATGVTTTITSSMGGFMSLRAFNN